MKVLLTGGTGFVGQHLVARLLERNAQVLVHSRSPRKVRGLWGAAVTPVRELGELAVDAIINLTGESVFGRWTSAKRARLWDSRVQTTQALADMILRAPSKPKVMISASAVGYYGLTQDQALDEEAPPGQDFLAQLCRDWEASARRVESTLRLVIVRVGLVLGHEGGPLPRMLPAFRMALGGPLGEGQQWMSWIHIDDLVQIFLSALDDPALCGPINGCGPAPCTNQRFTEALADALGRPARLRVPRWALSMMFGEAFGEALTGGQRALPKRLLERGFVFRHPELEGALAALL